MFMNDFLIRLLNLTQGEAARLLKASRDRSGTTSFRIQSRFVLAQLRLP